MNSSMEINDNKKEIKFLQREKDEKSIEIIDFEKVINFEIKSKQLKIQRKNTAQEIPILINLSVDFKQAEKERAGLDLYLMIDISGSMGGKKLNLLKKTLNFIIEQLEEIDRIAISTFNGTSNLLQNFHPMTKSNKILIKKIIDEIKAGGETNIIDAFEKCLDVLANRTYINETTAAFLLSDGEDTCGGDIKLLKKIFSQKEETLKKKNMDYTIHTFGYGEDYDEVFLTTISDFKNGNFYNIKKPELVAECFIDCLSSLLTVIAKNAQINILLQKNMKITNKYGNEWKEFTNDNNGVVNIGAITNEMNKNIFFEITLSDIPQNEKLLKIAFCLLNFSSNERKFSKSKTLVLEIVDNEDDVEIDQFVEEEFIKIKTLKELTYFEKLNEQGRFAEAENKINQFKKNIFGNDRVRNEFKHQMEGITNPGLLRERKYNRTMQEVISKQKFIPGFNNMYEQSRHCKNMIKNFYL